MSSTVTGSWTLEKTFDSSANDVTSLQVRNFQINCPLMMAENGDSTHSQESLDISRHGNDSPSSLPTPDKDYNLTGHLRWLETVSSTFQDLQFDGSWLMPKSRNQQFFEGDSEPP